MGRSPELILEVDNDKLQPTIDYIHGTLMKHAIGETLCVKAVSFPDQQLQGRIRIMTRRATLPTNPIIVNSSSRSMIMALSGGRKEGRVTCNHSLLPPYSPLPGFTIYSLSVHFHFRDSRRSVQARHPCHPDRHDLDWGLAVPVRRDWL